MVKWGDWQGSLGVESLVTSVSSRDLEYLRSRSGLVSSGPSLQDVTDIAASTILDASFDG